MSSGCDFFLSRLIWVSIGVFLLHIVSWNLLTLLNDTARRRVTLLIAPITKAVGGIVLCTLAYAASRRANPLFEEYLYGPLALLQLIGLILLIVGINQAVRISSSAGKQSPAGPKVLHLEPTEDWT